MTPEQLREKRKEYENQTRPQYWKNEARNNPGQYSESDLARMREGDPPYNHPTAGSDGHPIELHHDLPLSKGGTNDPANLTPMTRTQHRLGGNMRLNHPPDSTS